MGNFTGVMARRFVLATAITGLLGFGAIATANPGVQNTDRLMEGLDELTTGVKAVKNGNHWKARIQLRRAYFKLKIAQISLERQTGITAVTEAIDLAILKMKPNNGLSLREKYNWGIGCVAEALKFLINDTFRGKKVVRKHIAVAKKLVKVHYFTQAVNAIRAARAKVRGVPQARQALSVAIEKIEAPFLNKQEKVTWGLDCMNVALRALNSTRRGLHG